MAMVSMIGAGACEATIDGLRAEFGAVLAARILEAEMADFLWEARVRERYLGQEIGFEDDADAELFRVKFLSFLAGNWHAGTCLADGDGRLVALLWEHGFERREDAEGAFERAG